MNEFLQSATISKASLWSGRIMSTLMILFLIFDGVIHILRPVFVVDAFKQLGFPKSFALVIGIIELACLALYLIPRTSVLGAILLTGYLGGAVVTNMRAGSPLFSTTLFPVYIGILLWGGLYLRDARLQSLIPFRKD